MPSTIIEVAVERRENNSLTPDEEKLRGKDEVAIELGLFPTRLWLVFIEHAFVQIVGLCVFVYAAVVPWWGVQFVANLVSQDRFGRPVQRQTAHSPYSG